MKKILVLGTGMPQADLIKAAKERNHTVFACSYVDGDPAQKYADCFQQINIVDKEAVCEYAEKNEVDYVYSVGSDVAMPTVFYVSEKLGLPCFCTYETAEICNRKPLLRERLGTDFEGNLKYQKLYSDNEELKVPFPVMIKPSDSQGQRGVYRVDNKTEFKNCFNNSLAFSREKAVIAEEFVCGDEISVNTFSVNGKLIFSLVSDRIIRKEYPGGIIHKHIIPSKFSNNVQALCKINDLVNRTLKKLKIENGPAYFQIIINESGEPKLIEVTPRLDGCHMWRLIKMSTGIDLLNMSLDLLEGKEISDITEYNTKPYMTEFLGSEPESVFSKINYTVDSVDYIEWYYNEGDRVKRMNGYMEKCGYIIKRL